MHNSPLKCTTNDVAMGSSPIDMVSPAKKGLSAAADVISPEKRARENVSSTGTYQSPPRNRKVGSPNKNRASPSQGKKKAAGVPFGKPIEIIRSKFASLFMAVLLHGSEIKLLPTFFHLESRLAQDNFSMHIYQILTPQTDS